MSLLDQLTKTTHPASKRVGRGYGSGQGGHASGRGQKGQRSRKSGKSPDWFEGGQLPLVKRLPMWRGKGRQNVLRPTAEVTLGELQRMKADTITLETLKLEKVIDSRFKAAKIILSGKLDRKLSVKGVRVTAGARQAIEAAGGSVEVA